MKVEVETDCPAQVDAAVLERQERPVNPHKRKIRTDGVPVKAKAVELRSVYLVAT